MQYAALDDGTLIRLIAQQRDAEALSILYDRYHRVVYSVALHLLDSQSRAEEATLDVFTRVWEKANTYDAERGEVRTWVLSMARYRAIDILRHQGARPEANSIPLTAVEYQLQARSHNPERATARSLQAERVHRALAELPEEQRQIIWLTYFWGQTQRQIADMLDLPLGTVKTRVRLAMKKLRRFFSQESTDPESSSERINE